MNFIRDSFRSMLTGLGVPGRDKVMSMMPTVDFLTYNRHDLEALYRSNWCAKKIVDLPAFDCTRAWRTWDAEQDDADKLVEAEREFGLQHKMMSALIKSRLYGGSAILMGIKGTPFNEELDIDSVGKGDLKFIHVVEKWMMQAGPRVRDITSPWFGEPSYYMRSNNPIVPAPGNVTPLEQSSLGHKPGDTLYIHPSRVVRLTGAEYPDMENSPDAWGDSVLTSIYEAIRDAGLVTQSLANMIADGKVDVFKIPGLTSTLSTQAGTDKMISYLANANIAKSTVNALVIDKEIDWERIQTKFEGLPQVLQAYLLICAAGADIPSTRMLSREPSGQNATGESDIRNYYDRLSSEQKVILTPKLSRLDEVLIRHTLGDRPEEIKYDWNPLWQMSEAEKSDIALKKAQAYQIDVNTALIPAEALVKGRENQLIEDGTYPGLETALDDIEDNWEADVEFLPHMQMGQQSEMQETQLSAQEKQAKMMQQGGKNKPGAAKGGGKTSDSFYDEGGQSSLSFMIGRRPNGKSPFVARGDTNAGLPTSGHSHDPLVFEDADWDESKHPRGQPGNAGQFGSGGGGASLASKVASVEAQHTAHDSIVGYLRQVSQIQHMPGGMKSKSTFILEHGTPYITNAQTYAGKRDPIQRCYMNATRDAMAHSDHTYVEGFITVHGVPIEHAWTVDSKGQVFDSTIRPDKAVAGYFGVPFTTKYLMQAMNTNGVYGLLGHSSRKTLEPLLRGENKEFKAIPDVSKLSSSVVADRLAFADRLLKSIPETDHLHSPERIALRGHIAHELYNKDIEKRTRNRQATIILGLPGSGKSTLSVPLVDSGRLEIDGDRAKAMLPEFLGGIGADGVHEESSGIMRNVLARAIKAGDDIVWPRIDSPEKIVADVKSLRDAGYEIDVKLVDVPQNVAIESAISRFLMIGRYVSPEHIASYGNKPRESFDAAVATGLVKSHERYERGLGKGFVEVT